MLRSWRPGRAAVARAALAALVMNTLIVVTGGAVRLTASGLGCPTWPRCTDESFVATREMGVHGAVEFGNRLLTYVLAAAVLAAVVTAVRRRPRRRLLVRLSLLLLAGIVAQAVLGGVTVLTGLNPLTVMAHFLLSMGLLAAAVLLWERAREAPVHAVRPEVRLAVVAVVVVTAATLVAGTVVTGTGPHSGDPDATDRLPFDPATVTQVHADLVFLLLGLAAGTALALRATGAAPVLVRRAVRLLVVLLAQAGVGYVQYVTDLPVALVAVHVLGACLVWLAALHLLVGVRPAPRRPAQNGSSGSSATATNSSVR
jgi:cytochrome c oxidase assembly protein subunit 15